MAFGNKSIGSMLESLLQPVPLVQRTPTGGLKYGLGTEALNVYLEAERTSMEIGLNAGPAYIAGGFDVDIGGVYGYTGLRNVVEVGGFVGFGGGLAYIDAPVANMYAVGVASLMEFRVDTGKSAEEAKTVLSVANPIGQIGMYAVSGLIQAISALGKLGGSGGTTTQVANNSSASQASLVAPGV
jgi:hypothetical protein